jgi:hypothetical protein
LPLLSPPVSHRHRLAEGRLAAYLPHPRFALFEITESIPPFRKNVNSHFEKISRGILDDITKLYKRSAFRRKLYVENVQKV